MTARLLILALSLLVTAPSVAQEGPEPPRPAEVQPSPKAEVSANLRAEYLAGEPILVRFEVSNPHAQPIVFPDLAGRPHLVRFHLTGPDGEETVRFNTPPAEDGGRTWTLSPRGRRQVLLQVPSSAVFAPGGWSITVHILTGSGELVLPSHDFVLARARPVAGSMSVDALGTARAGHVAVWVHKAKDGYDLFLHHADGRRPERTIGDYHLAHLERRVDPVLTHSRPQERWGRYLYWQLDDRTVEYVQLDGQQLRGERRRLQVPWPGVEVMGRGSTDADGGLHVPLWVPGPRGTAGELRVASVRSPTGPRFRSVARLPRPPTWVETAVDGTGALRLLVSHDGLLDLYTVTATGELPAIGHRLDVDLAPLVARFGFLPDREESPGGLAVLGLYAEEEGWVGRWTTLRGKELHAWPVMHPPPGARPLDLLPRGFDAPVALSRPAEGPVQWAMPGRVSQPLGVDPSGVLLGTEAGVVLYRRLVPGGPVHHLRLVEAPPAPD